MNKILILLLLFVSNYSFSQNKYWIYFEGKNILNSVSPVSKATVKNRAPTLFTACAIF